MIPINGLINSLDSDGPATFFRIPPILSLKCDFIFRPVKKQNRAGKVSLGLKGVGSASPRRSLPLDHHLYSSMKLSVRDSVDLGKDKALTVKPAHTEQVLLL